MATSVCSILIMVFMKYSDAVFKDTITIEMYSRGYDQSDSHGVYSWIKIDGGDDLTVYSSNGYRNRGHNVVVISEITGDVVDSVTYDTSPWNPLSRQNDNDLTAYLHTISPNDTIVAIVIWDDGEGASNATVVLQSWGCSLPKVQHRESFIFIGTPNIDNPSWQKCQISQQYSVAIYDSFTIDLTMMHPTTEPTEIPSDLPTPREPSDFPTQTPTTAVSTTNPSTTFSPSTNPSIDPTKYPPLSPTTVALNEAVIGNIVPTLNPTIRETEEQNGRNKMIVYVLLGCALGLTTLVCIMVFLALKGRRKRKSNDTQMTKTQVTPGSMEMVDSNSESIEVAIGEKEGVSVINESECDGNNGNHYRQKSPSMEDLFGSYITPNDIDLSNDVTPNGSPAITPIGDD